MKKMVSLFTLLSVVYDLYNLVLVEFVETSVVLMDEEEFKSSFFQRVFQNISLHSNRESLDEFMYLENTVEGNQLDCLDTLLRY